MIVRSWNVSNLAELLAAVTEAGRLAGAEGHSADAVNVNSMSVILVRQGLSDGTHCLDLLPFDEALAV